MSKPAGDPPLCKCHGEPMRWNHDKAKKRGGVWICQVVRRRSQNRHALSAKAKATRSEWLRTTKGYEYAKNKNARRMYVGSMYLGRVGFTESEIKEMISGSSD